MSADDVYAAGLCHGLEVAAGESHNGAGESHFTATQRWGAHVPAHVRGVVTRSTELKARLGPSRWRQLLCGGDGPPLLL